MDGFAILSGSGQPWQSKLKTISSRLTISYIVYNKLTTIIQKARNIVYFFPAFVLSFPIEKNSIVIVPRQEYVTGWSSVSLLSQLSRHEGHRWCLEIHGCPTTQSKWNVSNIISMNMDVAINRISWVVDVDQLILIHCHPMLYVYTPCCMVFNDVT